MRTLLYLLKLCSVPFLRKKFKASVCGHLTRRMDVLRAFGDRTVVSINGHPEYCHRCLEQAAIQCVFCGKAIFPTETPVTITLHDSLERFKNIHGIKILQKSPFLIIGCMRATCSDSAANRAGFWVMPGQVEKASVCGAALSLPDCEAVHIKDVSSLPEARELARRCACR